MKTKNDLKEGKCIVIVKNEITGKTREVEGSYNKKLNVVYCLYKGHENIIGYKQ